MGSAGPNMGASARRAGVEAGARALLLASVRRLDDVYAVEMRAVDPTRDEYLFTVREQTAGKKGLLDVIDRLSERTRAELKEAQGEIRASRVPVAIAATSNLEANAHYFRSPCSGSSVKRTARTAA